VANRRASGSSTTRIEEKSQKAPIATEFSTVFGKFGTKMANSRVRGFWKLEPKWDIGRVGTSMATHCNSWVAWFAQN